MLSTNTRFKVSPLVHWPGYPGRLSPEGGNVSLGNVAERFDARQHGPYPEVSLNRRAAEPGTGRASRGAYVFAPNVAPSVITHRWPSLVNRGARKLHP